MSIKSVMAFLNSELYQYLYIVLFSEIKILKGNLNELPFPNLQKHQDEKLVNLVDENLAGTDNQNLINEEIYKIFNIDDEQKSYIRNTLKTTFSK